ncbi:tetratricopeptide repeat protein [Aquabacter cavernae]|uniref:tetratricopeptide repeat protein n=1 Tax=Aquabacter cavernae TaxID=2496029 RepID=UPI000F8ED91D|nr:tetratricopeptide repeat protein [Aquabacter cavernae]
MGWLDRLRRPAAPAPEAEMEQALAAARAGDYAAALDIWERLGRAGHARAQNNIGACFAEGMGGLARDPALAERWLSLSAAGGDSVGRRNLAALYFKGEGVTQDYARAADLYRAAAEQGDAPAQDMLSWMLLEGEVVPLDITGARLWAEAAADQGVASSMTRLGMLHHNALGVARDAAEAARWWRKGAERGDADGQAMLGAAHHLGAGVPRDPQVAYEWLLRGHEGGSGLAAPFLEAVKAALSPAALADAEERARRPLAPPVPEAAP